MWKWAQGAVAAVAGTVEPEYGKEAFQSVDSTVADKNPFTKLSKEDYNWQQPSQSHVETQTFYFHNNEYYGFAQLIHSNPVNFSYTSQFTFLLRNSKDPNFKVWGSHRLENAEVVDGTEFRATEFSIKLADDLKSYTFSGLCGDGIKVDLKFECVDEGFKIGDGFSKYGTDLNQPWGVMRHIFWPRTKVSGAIAVPKQQVFLPMEDGQGLFVMALQGMKPHHAAARWNFLDFQGPTTSVAVMEFKTPLSYGSQRSSIGAVIKDGKLLMTAVDVDIEHLNPELDAVDDANWNVPTKIKFELAGPGVAEKGNNKSIKVKVTGDLKNRVDRVDVMAELPTFVKRVASGLSGARPFIYQYYNELEVEVTQGDKTFREKGMAFSEATFIS